MKFQPVKFECRPWGCMITLLSFKWFWIKILYVEGRTSEQHHRYRAELHIGSYGIRYFPRFRDHRLTKGLYLEIAWGRVDELDIVRLSDDYGRV